MLKKKLEWDYRQRIGLFLLIIFICMLTIALALMFSAKFADEKNHYLGNGFWLISQHGIGSILRNWDVIADQYANQLYYYYPVQQVLAGIIFMIFLTPFFFISGSYLFIRGWVKSQI